MILRTLWCQIQFPAIWLVEDLVSIINIMLKTSTTIIWIIRYQYIYNKTLILSIDIRTKNTYSLVMSRIYLSSNPGPKLFPLWKPLEDSSCHGLNKRALTLTTIELVYIIASKNYWLLMSRTMQTMDAMMHVSNVKSFVLFIFCQTLSEYLSF